MNKESYKQESFLRNKTSALINLLNLLTSPSNSYLEEVINFAVPQLLRAKPDIENFCFLIDSVNAIEKRYDIEIRYSDEVLFHLQSYFSISIRKLFEK